MAGTEVKKVLGGLRVYIGKLKESLVTDESLTPVERAKRIKNCENDDLLFAKTYYPKIFSEPWNDIHYFLADLRKGKYTISGARRFGKSAFSYVTKVIKPIVMGNREGVINVSLRTLYFARERVASIVNLMLKNKLLMYDYPIEITQNRKGHYIINGIHLIGTGVHNGLRAVLDENFNRFIVSINDDLYNVQTVYSERDNKKVYDFITSEVYGQMEEDGLCITLGNSITADCPIRLLKQDNPENHFSLPATNENGITNWKGHSLFTDEFWLTKQKEIPHEVWMGEYMDSPVERGEVFDSAWIKFEHVNEEKIRAAITVIDPGYGESPSACRKGIITLGLLDSGKLAVLDILLTNEDYPRVFGYVNQVHKTIPSWKIFMFENDFNQWHIAKPYYEMWCNQFCTSLPLMHFTAKDLKTEFFASDKESRILNLVYPHQTGELVYSAEFKGDKNFDEFKAQYTGFGKAGVKVDGLDALASAFILINRYKQNNNFKSLKKRAFNSQEQKWLNRL